MSILFDEYKSGPYFDEVFSPDGTPRAHYQVLLQRLGILKVDDFQRRHALAELTLRNQGITFAVYGGCRP